MKVLVTGATGFLGSNIVKGLLREKHQVTILKRSFSDTWRINDALKYLDCYDIDKCKLMEPFQRHNGFDAIIHTATCYGRNGEGAEKIVNTNVLFPLKLLEIAVFFKTKMFFNTDTFFNMDNNIESYQYLKGYTLSKKQFLEWGKQFAAMKKIHFINVRLEHVYGPKDDIFKFIPFIIKSCIENVPELKLTLGEQKRDFVYIDDVVAAYLLLLNKSMKNIFESFNLGSGNEVSIREIVETIQKITGSSTILKFGALPYRSGEIMESHADISMLKNMGWFPNVSLVEGLKSCIRE